MDVMKTQIIALSAMVVRYLLIVVHKITLVFVKVINIWILILFVKVILYTYYFKDCSL